VMNSRRRMSASDEAAGPRQTSILKEYVFGLMSALPPKADMVQPGWDVALCQTRKYSGYSP